MHRYVATTHEMISTQKGKCPIRKVGWPNTPSDWTLTLLLLLLSQLSASGQGGGKNSGKSRIVSVRPSDFWNTFSSIVSPFSPFPKLLSQLTRHRSDRNHSSHQRRGPGLGSPQHVQGERLNGMIGLSLDASKFCIIPPV